MTGRAKTTLERAAKAREAVEAEFPDDANAQLMCLSVAGQLTIQASDVLKQLAPSLGDRKAERLLLQALKITVSALEWACDEAHRMELS